LGSGRRGIGREAPDSPPPKSTRGRGHFDAAHAARNLLRIATLLNKPIKTLSFRGIRQLAVKPCLANTIACTNGTLCSPLRQRGEQGWNLVTVIAIIYIQKNDSRTAFSAVLERSKKKRLQFFLPHGKP